MINCWVCMDKGAVLTRLPEKNGNETLYYWYSLYCDKCEKGNNNRVDHVAKDGTRWYEPPVSQHLDTAELAKHNRENYKEKTA